MNQLINKSLEIAIKALEGQNDKDVQFTRSLEMVNFIMDIQAKQAGEAVIGPVTTKEVIKEVQVEVVKEVPRYVRVTPNRRIRQVNLPVRTVTKEVVTEVQVPVEVIKEVKVPVEVIKEVIKEVPKVVEINNPEHSKLIDTLNDRVTALTVEVDVAEEEVTALKATIAKLEAEKLELKKAAFREKHKDVLPTMTAIDVAEDALADLGITEQKVAAAQLAATKAASHLPIPPVLKPAEESAKALSALIIEEEPKKETPRPVVRLGAHFMPEANMIAYVYEAFITGKKVFERTHVKEVAATDKPRDVHYAHYVAAAQAIVHAKALNFDKVKFVSTVNLRPDQMTSVDGVKYAGFVASNGIKVFSESNADVNYNQRAERALYEKVLGAQTEEAPF